MYSNSYNRNNRKPNPYRSNDQAEWKELKKPDRPLSQYYANKSELLLPDGYAYKIAAHFQKKVTTHQLRKILSLSKEAVVEVDANHFDQARNKLYTLLPLSAYNAGRDKKNKEMRELFEFLKANIKPETLKDKADIYIFDELITSIIAYHKYLGGK